MVVINRLFTKFEQNLTVRVMAILRLNIWRPPAILDFKIDAVQLLRVIGGHERNQSTTFHKIGQPMAESF